METRELLMGCTTATLKAHRKALWAEAAVVSEILKGRAKANKESALAVRSVERVNATAPEDAS